MDDKQLKINLKYYSHYFDAMFWADVDNSDDIKGDYDLYSIDEDTLKGICAELDLFFEKADHILEETDYTHEQACHDFYLTRCGHGAGFWENDHCNQEQGEKLTEIAKEFGPVYICENDTQDRLYIE